MIKVGSHPLRESREVSASYLESGDIFLDDDYYRVIRTRRKQHCIEITCKDRNGLVQTISYDLVGYDKFCVLDEDDFSWQCSATIIDSNDRSEHERKVFKGFDRAEVINKFEDLLKTRYPTRRGWRIRDITLIDIAPK